MPLVSEKQLRRYPITPPVMRSTARICTKNGITCSMTNGYDGYQNAMAERVNGTLKMKPLLIWRKRGRW